MTLAAVVVVVVTVVEYFINTLYIYCLTVECLQPSLNAKFVVNLLLSL